ncbi:MAG TPA: hypothetical protein VHP38_02055 [Ruminiclostridium sp.]|nr:hypothetical protein [Ruminiclostridium sp.]
MKAIFGYSWFELLGMIQINKFYLQPYMKIIHKTRNHSEVVGYPSGFT